MFRLCLIVLTLFALAFSDDDRHDEHGYHLPRDLRHLGLSERQHEALKGVLHTYRDQMVSLRRDHETTLKQAERLFVQDHFDAEAYKAAAARLEARETEIETELLSQIHTLLTPEQRSRFVDRLDEWIGR